MTEEIFIEGIPILSRKRMQKMFEEQIGWMRTDLLRRRTNE